MQIVANQINSCVVLVLTAGNVGVSTLVSSDEGLSRFEYTIASRRPWDDADWPSMIESTNEAR